MPSIARVDHFETMNKMSWNTVSTMEEKTAEIMSMDAASFKAQGRMRTKTALPIPDAKDWDHNETIAAACHLLLFSRAYVEDPSQADLNSCSDDRMRERFLRPRDTYEEDSDSFTPTSVTSGFTPSSVDLGSWSFDNVETEGSSLVTDSEVSSQGNSAPKKRRKVQDRLLAEIVGQEKESEILDRPGRKRRYRSLSELLQKLH